MSEIDMDIDEPPTKISKTEVNEKLLEEEHLEAEEEEEMGEGQEEWLSEGILTDDDYNPGAEQEPKDLNLTSACGDSQMSQPDETPSLDDSLQEETVTKDKSWTADIEAGEVTQATSETNLEMPDGIESDTFLDQSEKSNEDPNGTSTNTNDVQNIEEALNRFEDKSEITDVLDTFLIRKKDDTKVEVKDERDTTTVSVEQQNDDGNDTDELLRLLGDDDNKLKKKVLVKKSYKKNVEAEESSDDEFEYDAVSVKTLRVARNALMKGRPASKAMPEDMSEGENYSASSDEGQTMKKIFGVPVKRLSATASKNTAENISLENQMKPLVKHIVQLNKSSNGSNKSAHDVTPKKYPNENVQGRDQPVATLKPGIKLDGGPKTTLKPQSNFNIAPTTELKLKSAEERLHALKAEVKLHTLKPAVKLESENFTLKPAVNKTESEENEEIIDEEEFLEEDEDYDLDEDEYGEESEMDDEGTRKQRIMKPERMDEEVPSDADSHTEDGSLYDEIPSSDSEDLDDWFTLDIRSERAGDYLPLLGPKAREMLLEEKKRVSARLVTLRQSLSALTESGRKQAEQLRNATMSLAELDDMLKAT